MSNELVIERVARAIAIENGDDYGKVPKHKPHWVAHQGRFQDRFRDINEPFQSDYDGMATAAISAYKAALEDAGLVIVPREPTEAMVRIGIAVWYEEKPIGYIYRAMVAEATK